MVFTIAQWTAFTAEDFHTGATPIPPSELARNSQFFFALPARLNYAFPDLVLGSGRGSERKPS